MTLIVMIFLVVEIVVVVYLLTAPRYKIIQYAYNNPSYKGTTCYEKKKEIR